MNNMKRYIKDNVVKLANEIVIENNGLVTYNPSESTLFANGWREYVYVAPEKTIEEKVAEKKKEMLERINTYDVSDNVNWFYIGDYGLWLDKATRSGLKLRFEAEVALGHEETSLWHGNSQFPLPLSKAMQLLYALEVYASACYDRTQYHKMMIDSMTDYDEISSYDYTTGYPEKLRF